VTGDQGALPLVPFYKGYRAMVRCKVECFRLDDPQIPDDEKESARMKGAGYLRLARQYALKDRLPLSLVLVCGLMGSGKSTVATALSPTIGVDAISSDRVRKEITGTPVGVHRQAGYDSGIYTPEMNALTYRELLHRAEEEIAGGRSVIVDATFRRQRDRSMFRSLADRHGARCIIVVTQCPEEIARQRLEERQRKPDEISDGRWELYFRQQSEFEPPKTDEGSLIFVDTSGPINDTIDTILQEMGLLS
jgi:predicted kinase